MNQLGEVQELKKIGTCTAVIKYMEQMEEVLKICFFSTVFSFKTNAPFHLKERGVSRCASGRSFKRNGDPVLAYGQNINIFSFIHSEFCS